MWSRIATWCLAASVVLAATCAPAAAGVQAVWPNECTPVSGFYSVADAAARAVRTFGSLGAAQPAYDAEYECEVQLPAGTTITGLSVRGTTAAGSAGVTLRRVRLGGEPESVVSRGIFPGSAPAWYATSPEDVDASRAKVVAAYRYFVSVTVVGAGSTVQGVKVTYR